MRRDLVPATLLNLANNLKSDSGAALSLIEQRNKSACGGVFVSDVSLSG
jgi:hypothetical protein